MKKVWMMLWMMLGLSIAPTQQSQAVVWVVVKAAVKKVIKAMDLQIQRLQNKTIWLQNAQKQLENTLSRLKLEEISDWVEKHKEQYAGYYEELRKVKEAISHYRKVKEIMETQWRIVDAYRSKFALLRQDDHFTVEERAYMQQVYTGILDESLKNLDQLYLVIRPTMQMSDGKRLQLITEVAQRMDTNLNDLIDFNAQNMRMVLQRARNQAEVQRLKALYNIR